MRCFQLLLLLSNGSISLVTFLQSGTFLMSVGRLMENRIRCPKNSGLLYYNYKGYFSVIFMALVDANYKLIWVIVGANGSASELRIVLEEDNLGLPDADTLPGDERNTPFFLIGDDAFPLRTWML